MGREKDLDFIDVFGFKFLFLLNGIFVKYSFLEGFFTVFIYTADICFWLLFEVVMFFAVVLICIKICAVILCVVITCSGAILE